MGAAIYSRRFMEKHKNQEYMDLREAFQQELQDRLRREFRGKNVKIEGITPRTINAAHLWQDRRLTFSWISVWHKFRHNPKRFEFSVWSDDILCGLIIGQPSSAHEHLSVHFLEGNPGSTHPLKGRMLEIFMEGMTLYAYALSCQKLRVVDPVPGLVGRYRSLGFEVVEVNNQVVYCEKAVL